MLMAIGISAGCSLASIFIREFSYDRKSTTADVVDMAGMTILALAAIQATLKIMVHVRNINN